MIYATKMFPAPYVRLRGRLHIVDAGYPHRTNGTRRNALCCSPPPLRDRIHPPHYPRTLNAWHVDGHTIMLDTVASRTSRSRVTGLLTARRRAAGAALVLAARLAVWHALACGIELRVAAIAVHAEGRARGDALL